MTGIADLPDDLLGDIFLAAAKETLEHKINMARVSRRWCHVALSLPLLWSTLRLATTEDYFWLPRALDLSGASLPLDVELLLDSGDHAVMRTLALHAARIRSFDAQVPGGGHALAPLFNGDPLKFPVLQTLRVKTVNQRNVPLRFADAPVLRLLDLDHVDPQDIVPLLPPTLEVLRFVPRAPLQASDIKLILERCPRLIGLTFHTWEMDEDSGFEGLAEIQRRPLAPALRLLDLRLSLEDTVKVLDTGFQDVVLHEIAVCVYNGHDPEDMELLVGSLIHGLAPIVAFEVQDDQHIVLRDADERVRTMRVWNDDSSWDLTDVWRFLAERHSIHTSVRSIHIATKDWNELAEALAARPLGSQGGVRMRILTDWEDVHLERGGLLREMSEIEVPGLVSVVLLSGDGTGLPPGFPAHVLRCLRSEQHPARNVEVIIEGATAKMVPKVT